MSTFRLWTFTALTLLSGSAAAQQESYVIQIEVPGGSTVELRNCSGLGSHNEVLEQRISQPDGSERIRKIPGTLRWMDLTCARGLSRDLQLRDWRKLVEDGRVQEARRDVLVTMLDSTMTVVARWTLLAAWPSRLQVAVDETGASETLTVVAEGIVREL